MSNLCFGCLNKGAVRTVKYHIEKNTVQETLIIPLFGRLVCSERFPQLFSDPEARRICDSLDYGSSARWRSRSGSTISAARCRII